MKIMISLSAGVSQAKWDAMSPAEKKKYIKKYPNSKYAKTGNQAKKGADKGKSTKVQRKVTKKEATGYFVWSEADTPNEVKKAVKDIAKKAGVTAKIKGKIEDGDNYGYECNVTFPSKDDLKKFQEVYDKS